MRSLAVYEGRWSPQPSLQRIRIVIVAIHLSTTFVV
jgi:hypothetical protein